MGYVSIVRSSKYCMCIVWRELLYLIFVWSRVVGVWEVRCGVGVLIWSFSVVVGDFCGYFDVIWEVILMWCM